MKCDQCGKFCGTGCKQYRRYDWQGVPVEDYLICKRCEEAIKKPPSRK